MVVHQVNIVGVPVLVDAERDSPVAGNPRRPNFLVASGQLVQTETPICSQLLQRYARVEGGHYPRDLCELTALQPARVVLLEEPLKRPALEPPDSHSIIGPHSDLPQNPGTAAAGASSAKMSRSWGAIGFVERGVSDQRSGCASRRSARPRAARRESFRRATRNSRPPRAARPATRRLPLAQASASQRERRALRRGADSSACALA